VQVGDVAPLNVTQFFDGLVTVADPALFSDTSAKVRASIVGSIIAATGTPPPRVIHKQISYNTLHSHLTGLKFGCERDLRLAAAPAACCAVHRRNTCSTAPTGNSSRACGAALKSV
jgi:hypothetical protein